MALAKNIQSALQQTNGWATFLRVAYIGYVLLIVWLAAIYGVAPAIEAAGTGTAVFLDSILPVTLTVILLVLTTQYFQLPLSVGGMLHIFLPAPFLVLSVLFGEGNIALVQVAVIHLAGVCIAYPVWLFKAFVLQGKGKLSGRIFMFVLQLLFYTALIFTLVAFVQHYISYLDMQFAGDGFMAWVGVFFVVFFCFDQTRVYLKSVLAD